MRRSESSTRRDRGSSASSPSASTKRRRGRSGIHRAGAGSSVCSFVRRSRSGCTTSDRILVRLASRPDIHRCAPFSACRSCSAASPSATSTSPRRRTARTSRKRTRRSRRCSRQLESLNEIGNALATEVELPSVLQLVAERLRELVDARLVLIALPSGDESLRLATAEGKGTEGLVGMPLGLETSKAGRVFLRKRSERIDSVVDDPEVDQAAARRIGMSTALIVPLIVRDRAIGVISAVDKQQAGPRFTEDDLRLGEAFAARAAIAVDLSERVTRDALRRAVEAQELERRRLARELHDEIGQDLTSLLLGLKTIDEAGSGGKLKEATE